MISGSSSIDDTIEARILSESIGDFLKKLPKTERVVFVGRYYYCDSLKDIASYCRVSESKVKTLLFRTRTKLKNYLKKEGFNV